MYTDISMQLVGYGRRTYGPRFPFALFRLLDVEKDIQHQVCRSFSFQPPQLTISRMAMRHGALCGLLLMPHRLNAQSSRIARLIKNHVQSRVCL